MLMDSNNNKPSAKKYSSMSNSHYEEAERKSSSSDEDADDEKLTPPPSFKNLKSLSGGGYNQTYLIMKPTDRNDTREVFFKCGQWCYKGDIDLFSLKIGIADLPTIIPVLQRQQSKMKYYCPSKGIPKESHYYEPLNFIQSANEFISSEILSDRVESELKRWSSIFKWIQEDTAKTYFELLGEAPEAVSSQVDLIATKTYNHGLIVVSIYFQNTIYFVLQDGEGDQPLLDVSFPNVSRHGQGLLIANYYNPVLNWSKMTLWHNIDDSATAVASKSRAQGKDIVPKTQVVGVKPATVNMSSKDYMQIYCIKKSKDPVAMEQKTMASNREVLFRFGNWCYAGIVQLIPTMSLADIPFVIPALRMQQSKLTFLCDSAHVPEDNEFAPALQYMHTLLPLIADQVTASEGILIALIDKLSSMGVGDSVARWLQGDASNSFFEFKVAHNDSMHRAFKDVELLASKCYIAGVITITIIFQNNVYVGVQEVADDNPLLDSKFPDISGKGRGYQLQCYDNGIPGWTTLRKVSIWQTVAALEGEFRERSLTLLNQAKMESMAEESSPKASELVDGKTYKESTEIVIEDKPAGIKEAQTECKREDLKQGGSKDTIDSPAQPQFISGLLAGDIARSVPSLSIARPHHLPKMELLSMRVEELRRTMNEEGETSAPWDIEGKPLKAKPMARK